MAASKYWSLIGCQQDLFSILFVSLHVMLSITKQCASLLCAATRQLHFDAKKG